jgi:hypothetical protein
VFRAANREGLSADDFSYPGATFVISRRHFRFACFRGDGVPARGHADVTLEVAAEMGALLETQVVRNTLDRETALQHLLSLPQAQFVEPLVWSFVKGLAPKPLKLAKRHVDKPRELSRVVFGLDGQRRPITDTAKSARHRTSPVLFDSIQIAP